MEDLKKDFFGLEALESLEIERFASNPLRLERCLSNFSACSQEGGAFFVPFGRGQQEYLATNTNNAIDFDDINKMLQAQAQAQAQAQEKGEQKQPAVNSLSRIGEPVHVPMRLALAPAILPLQPIITQPQPQPQPKISRIDRKHNKKNNLNRMEIRDIIKQNISLRDLLNHDLICKLLKDQNGSRFIQDKLTKNKDTKLIDIVLDHIIFTRKDILNLSEDIFGNYVIQIFFDIGNKKQIKLLFDHLLIGNVHRLTHSLYGCRVIQKAFDCIQINESIQLINELSRLSNELFKKCICGPNSNHVIQKILMLNIDSKYFEFIIQCINVRIFFYSSHIFGCRIVQNLIKLKSNNNNHNTILMSIINNDELLNNLSKSEYGNYVIQDIIKFNGNHNKIISMVKHNIFKNILLLSKNKFGSNVVEKCLMISSTKDIDTLLNKLLVKHKNISKMILVEMIQDKFANYVIQKLLSNSNHKQQSKMIYFIQKNIPNLKSLKYGKHIMDKIKKTTKSEYYNQYYY